MAHGAKQSAATAKAGVLDLLSQAQLERAETAAAAGTCR
jgi:hypothetical protein